jgi:hypothetical protein
MMKIKDPLTGEMKEKGVTTLGPTSQEPEAAPPIVSASGYSQRVKAKQQALKEAKQHSKPVGGAPPIPEGKLEPVVAAARAAHAAMNMPKPFWAPPDPPPAPPQFTPPPAPPPKPPPMPGVGGGLAVNQAMASGQLERPITLGEAKRQGLMHQQKQGGQGPPAGTVSPETRQLLEMQSKQMDEPKTQQAQPEQPTMATRKEALAGAEKELVEGAKEDLFPIFDFGPISAAQQKMMSAERRKQIEERLSPLNFVDLIQRGDVQQNIPVIPGQFELMLRTVSQRENLFCMQYIYEHPGSAEYTAQLFNTCKVACAVVAINGGMLPDHRKNIGQPNEEVERDAFVNKLNIILRMPTVVLADMGIQYDWFNERIASFFSVEKLKNG